LQIETSRSTELMDNWGQYAYRIEFELNNEWNPNMADRLRRLAKNLPNVCVVELFAKWSFWVDSFSFFQVTFLQIEDATVEACREAASCFPKISIVRLICQREHVGSSGTVSVKILLLISDLFKKLISS